MGDIIKFRGKPKIKKEPAKSPKSSKNWTPTDVEFMAKVVGNKIQLDISHKSMLVDKAFVRRMIRLLVGVYETVDEGGV